MISLSRMKCHPCLEGNQERWQRNFASSRYRPSLWEKHDPLAPCKLPFLSMVVPQQQHHHHCLFNKYLDIQFPWFCLPQELGWLVGCKSFHTPEIESHCGIDGRLHLGRRGTSRDDEQQATFVSQRITKDNEQWPTTPLVPPLCRRHRRFAFQGYLDHFPCLLQAWNQPLLLLLRPKNNCYGCFHLAIQGVNGIHLLDPLGRHVLKKHVVSNCWVKTPAITSPKKQQKLYE